MEQSVANDQLPGWSCKHLEWHKSCIRVNTNKKLNSNLCFWKISFKFLIDWLSLRFFSSRSLCFTHDLLSYPSAIHFRICSVCPDLPSKNGSRFYFTFIFCFWQTWQIESTLNILKVASRVYMKKLEVARTGSIGD